MIIPMTDDERRLTEEYLYLVPEMVKKLTSRCAYATFRTLAQDIQFTHAGYPVLEAISNLYLNKQIAFEKL